MDEEKYILSSGCGGSARDRRLTWENEYSAEGVSYILSGQPDITG
jgi:hypothetical protein